MFVVYKGVISREDSTKVLRYAGNEVLRTTFLNIDEVSLIILRVVSMVRL